MAGNSMAFFGSSTSTFGVYRRKIGLTWGTHENPCGAGEGPDSDSAPAGMEPRR
jgi:hypothetical protein